MESQTVFEPKCMQEDGIERLFGTIKHIKNNPASTTVAQAIQATQLVHYRQKRKRSEAWMVAVCCCMLKIQ